jgi:queuine tRNA-ribosyltransferase
MLASFHNLFFLNQLVLDARHAIEENCFPAFKKEFLEKYKKGEESTNKGE